LDGYKISLVVCIVFVVVMGIVIGLPTAKLFVGLPDYGLNVDPVISNTIRINYCTSTNTKHWVSTTY